VRIGIARRIGLFAHDGCGVLSFRCTLGLGMTQPGKWKDAGRALDNPALEGCHMPDGPGVRSAGQQYLQYNEVRSCFHSVRRLCIEFGP
jgi:hypothetical protein